MTKRPVAVVTTIVLTLLAVLAGTSRAQAADTRTVVNGVKVEVEGTLPAATAALVVRGMRALTAVTPAEAGRFVLAVGTTHAWLVARVNANAHVLHANEVVAFRHRMAAGEMPVGGDWAYSLRGPNTQVVLVNVPARFDASTVTLTALKEAAEGLVGWWGGRSPGWPCWAAEGLGKPAAYAAWGTVTGRNGDAALAGWLREMPKPSVAQFTAAERFDVTCLANGTGHRLGAGLSRMLSTQFGPRSIAAFVKASPGPNWRSVFKQRFKMSVEQAYARTARTWPVR